MLLLSLHAYANPKPRVCQQQVVLTHKNQLELGQLFWRLLINYFLFSKLDIPHGVRLEAELCSENILAVKTPEC